MKFFKIIQKVIFNF